MQITVNDQPQAVSEGTTVAQLLEQLGLKDKPLAVEVNHQVVPRAEHAHYRLAPGDRIEIVTLVGGG